MTYTKFDKLKQRKQMANEPIAAYYDDIVNLCREIDPQMSEHLIIQYLISGLDQRFKKAVSRHGPNMETLNDFLTYAKIEQDLHETFGMNNHPQFEIEKQFSSNIEEPIPSITAAIKPENQIQKQIKRKQQSFESHPIQELRISSELDDPNRVSTFDNVPEPILSTSSAHRSDSLDPRLLFYLLRSLSEI